MGKALTRLRQRLGPVRFLLTSIGVWVLILLLLHPWDGNRPEYFRTVAGARAVEVGVVIVIQLGILGWLGVRKAIGRLDRQTKK
jgi:hypothetical protein